MKALNMIKPSHEIITKIEDNFLDIIETAGRICYKSEKKDRDKFISNIIKRGHLSVIEHANVTVKVIQNRGFTHEMVRHRLAAYSQECLVGDTLIKTGSSTITIKELYDRKNGSCYDKTHNKTINLKSINEKGEVINNKMKDVFYKGKNKVYKLTTNLGYSIECTLNHKFFNQNKEYVNLSDLKIRDNIYVNGRPSLIKITDEKLTQLYLEESMSPMEISEKTNSPYRAVIRGLKKLNIFVKRKNDKNKEKYTKNHTKESYNKIKKTIQNQYKEGRQTWNKNIKGKESHSFNRKVTLNERIKASLNKRGKLNPAWKGVGKQGHILARELKKHIIFCELCGEDYKLEVHHRDKNPKNNKYDNLIKVCYMCHNLLHSGWHVGKKIILDKIKSIEYIGIKDTYDLEMQVPFHNYIANGFVVHNSTRYVSYAKEQHGKKLTFIKPYWWKGKEKASQEEQLNQIGIYLHYLNCEKLYMSMIKNGMVPQEARGILPNDIKTEIIITTNLREWRHIFQLRCSKAAHPDMRRTMVPLLEEFKKKIPIIFDDLNFELNYRGF